MFEGFSKVGSVLLLATIITTIVISRIELEAHYKWLLYGLYVTLIAAITGFEAWLQATKAEDERRRLSQ